MSITSASNKEKAINIRLNNLSGQWDTDKLEQILDELELQEFDISLTGFDLDDIIIDMDGDYEIPDETKYIDNDNDIIDEDLFTLNDDDDQNNDGQIYSPDEIIKTNFLGG